MGIKLYVEVKKKESALGLCPLCIDIFYLDIDELQSFDALSGSNICAEVPEKEANVIGLVDPENDLSCCASEFDTSNVITASKYVEIKKKPNI